MIIKAMAVAASRGTVFHHVARKNRDGSPARCRVMGRCKVWVRQPDRFKLPVKYGMYDAFYIDETNAGNWCATEPATVIEGP